jgi:hypothetical protein
MTTVTENANATIEEKLAEKLGLDVEIVKAAEKPQGSLTTMFNGLSTRTRDIWTCATSAAMGMTALATTRAVNFNDGSLASHLATTASLVPIFFGMIHSLHILSPQRVKDEIVTAAKDNLSPPDQIAAQCKNYNEKAALLNKAYAEKQTEIFGGQKSQSAAPG